MNGLVILSACSAVSACSACWVWRRGLYFVVTALSFLTTYIQLPSSRT